MLMLFIVSDAQKMLIYFGLHILAHKLIVERCHFSAMCILMLLYDYDDLPVS